MLHCSHTADRRVRSYTDRSMLGRNLVGDLLRLHPSPRPVGSRSIDNELGTVFPSASSSPSSASMSDTCSPFLAGDAGGLISRRHAGSRFDRSIDRRITKLCPSSALCGHVCASRRGGFPGQRGGGYFGDSADAGRSIDLERDRRGSLLVPGPRSDCGHRTSTTAAEILNPLAASERASEQANERPRESAQRMRARLVALCRIRACRVRIRQMCARACSHARLVREGRYFVSLWVADQIRRFSFPAILRKLAGCRSIIYQVDLVDINNF